MCQRDFVNASSSVSRMRLGDVGYVGLGTIHHLSLWRVNRMRKGARYDTVRESAGDVQIQRVPGGWNAVLAEGQVPQVMPAPDPGDWYENGEVFFVSSIDQ